MNFLCELTQLNYYVIIISFFLSDCQHSNCICLTTDISLMFSAKTVEITPKKLGQGDVFNLTSRFPSLPRFLMRCVLEITHTRRQHSKVKMLTQLKSFSILVQQYLWRFVLTNVLQSILLITLFYFIIKFYFQPEELIKGCASTIKLFDVMLEETHENNKVLVESISQDLDVDAVLTTMKDLYVCTEYYILYYMYSNSMCTEYYILYVVMICCYFRIQH